MLIQDVQKLHPPFHKPAGEAAYLIDTGKFFAVQSDVEKPAPNLKWAARHGVREGDYQFPPQIFHSCSTCGTKGWTESQKGTAHTSVVVRHCGVVEHCPEDVGAKYTELFNAWKSRSRKPGAQRISAWTSNPRNLPVGLQVISLK